MKKQELIKRLNENILSDYNITLDRFEKAEKSSILAYFRLDDNTININIHNKLVFNDYIQFIETMLHENIHKINFKNGLEDVYMDGEKQIHNDIFRDVFKEEYGFTCDENEYNGMVDMADEKNKEAFKGLLINRILHEEEFKKIRDIYLDKIYEPLDDEEQEQQEQQDKKGKKEEHDIEDKVEEKDQYNWIEEEGEEI